MRLFRNLDTVPDRFRGGAVTIGNFDGVHLGHARIAGQLVARARQLGAPAVVLTFDPHPARLLRPSEAPPSLCWTERKALLLAQIGADAVIAYPTDEGLLKLDPRQFFEEIVLGQLRARAVVEGTNFFFGRGRRGNVEVLRGLCSEAGIALDVVDPVEVDAEVVSSSRVRSLIAEGRVDEAGRMLTQPYRVRGTVIRGAGRGASLGYPTANVVGLDTLLPGEGIYAGRGLVDGRLWPAAISVGPNPTFDETTLKFEAHLAGYAGDLYERVIEVDFLERLRDIARFESTGPLVAQMDRDVAATCELVARHES